MRSLQGGGTSNDAHLPTDPAPDSHPEGVANPRIFLTPSEEVADPHIFPLLPKELPVPPSEGVQFCHVFSPPSEGAQMTLLVIGRLVSIGHPLRVSFRVASLGFHSGRCRLKRLISTTFSKIRYEPTCFMPQRQGIAGFAAVVEGKRKRETAQKACIMGDVEKTMPQRQGIAGFGAVVE